MHDLYNLSVWSENGKEIVRRTEKIAKNSGFNVANVAQVWLMSKECTQIVGLGTWTSHMLLYPQ